MPASSSFSQPSAAAPKPQRILLLQLKRIGDFILTAPAVAALRAAHPQAEIVAVVPAAMADLAAGLPGLDRVLIYRAGRLNAAVWASLCFGEWDACYDFTGTDRSALMAWLSRATTSTGYARFASEGWRERAYTQLCEASVRDLHTVDFHVALTGCDAQPTQAGRVFAVPASSAIAQRLGSYDNFVVIHLGTAREEKFWPAQRWVEVIAHLVLKQGRGVVLTGTDAGLERAHLDALRAALRAAGIAVGSDAAMLPAVLDLTGQLSLVGTAQVIAASTLALGVDSMAMHLAAMQQKPQIVLYGPTNPFHWRPRHADAVVLVAGQAGSVEAFEPRAKGAAMELIAAASVIAEVDRLLFVRTE